MSLQPNKCHVFQIPGPAQSGKTTIGLAMVGEALKRNWKVLLLVGGSAAGIEASSLKKAYGKHLPIKDIRRRPHLKDYNVVVVDSDHVTPRQIELMSREMAEGHFLSTLLWLMTSNETEQPEA